MGLFDGGLFGDSGGGVTNPHLQKLIKNLSKKMVSELGQPADVYAGQIVPGVNANQQTAFDAAGGLLYEDPAIGEGISRLLSGQGDPQAVRDYYNESVLAPATQAFNDQLQQIGETYGDTWGVSGAHPKMVADATSRFGTGIGSVLGELVYNDRNAALDRIGTGVGLAQNQQQQRAGMLGQVLGIGDYQRGLDAENYQADYQKWLAGQDYNNPWLGFLGTTLGTAQQEAPQAGLLEKGLALTRTILPF